MTILIMVIAESEEELQKNCKKIESRLMGMQMKIRNLANLVRNAFKSITPFNVLDDKVILVAIVSPRAYLLIASISISISCFIIDKLI